MQLGANNSPSPTAVAATSASAPPPALPAPLRMFGLITSFALPNVLALLARWHVPDHLAAAKNGSLTTAELAKLVGEVPENNVDKLLRHCVNHGVFVEVGKPGSRVWANNDLSEVSKGQQGGSEPTVL